MIGGIGIETERILLQECRGASCREAERNSKNGAFSKNHEMMRQEGSSFVSMALKPRVNDALSQRILSGANFRQTSVQ